MGELTARRAGRAVAAALGVLGSIAAIAAGLPWMIGAAASVLFVAAPFLGPKYALVLQLAAGFGSALAAEVPSIASMEAVAWAVAAALWAAASMLVLHAQPGWRAVPTSVPILMAAAIIVASVALLSPWRMALLSSDVGTRMQVVLLGLAAWAVVATWRSVPVRS